MAQVQSGARIAINNILYMTDFSQPSEAALPFAASIAREYRAKIYAFHALIPGVYTTPETAAADLDAQEDDALTNMQHVNAQLAGLPHETIVERNIGVWPALEAAVKDFAIDLIVVGTHGRTGAKRPVSYTHLTLPTILLV